MNRGLFYVISESLLDLILGFDSLINDDLKPEMDRLVLTEREFEPEHRILLILF